MAPTGEVVPPIMITTAADLSNASTKLPSPAPEKKRRGRRGGRKTNAVDMVGSNPKKSLLLDELGDALVEQLYSTSKLDDPLNSSISSVPVVDHRRGNLTTALTTSSSASSRSSSSRTLTGIESTPPTSLDDRDSHDISLLPPSTVVPTLGRQYQSSRESLQMSLHDESSSSSSSNSSNHQNTNGRPQGDVFCLDDFTTMTAIQRLTAQFGRVAHMGIMDRSYRFFVNTSRTAALSFKIHNRVAIVGGDPLCEPEMILGLLEEFASYRHRHHWGIAFMGASEHFVKHYAQPQGWATIRFGTERVLNPQTNEVLLERGGKRIAVQTRQLLNPHKGATSLGVYAPAVHGTDAQLQAELIAVYDTWRAERNHAAGPQAFITVYDPFALPTLMTFVYSRGPDGQISGFAALRKLGCGGYHVDPCIAAPGSPKGISDLLIVAAMALLHRASASYLGFGFEPVHSLSPEDISGIPGPLAKLTRDLYSHTFHRLPIHGKKAYHDKFRPDSLQDSGLYLVFPAGMPGPRHLLAMIHMANISLRKILWADFRAWVAARKSKSSASSQQPALTDSPNHLLAGNG
ncbi:hypothetical protein N7462_011502 [Penicillium macrosclerotiorum]|uniref:uncharacterized protein n=1 Tax=Penicillium macrosclerotiorum TaxID=303699 RepID=UPI002549BE39|nr:uncharacterized protein N7462_011502 [Penicillium macrosclerotiorum]KAJ5664689.1 hypothetical protein N7462_011502 [Penicillium macrosclerotiorum]